MVACRTIDPARQARRQQAPCRGARSDERDHVYFEHGMPVACDPERSAAAAGLRAEFADAACAPVPEYLAALMRELDGDQRPPTPISCDGIAETQGKDL